MFHVKLCHFYTVRQFHVKQARENDLILVYFVIALAILGIKKEAFASFYNLLSYNIVFSSQFPIQLFSTRNFVIVEASIC